MKRSLTSSLGDVSQAGSTDTPDASRKRKLPTAVKYYAVRAGHTPGVYMSWKECEQNITGFKNAIFKSFPTITEAEDFVAGRKSTKSSATESLQPPKFYAVAKGRVPGVYTDWDSAQAQIVGWKGPKYKKFNTRIEAEEFVRLGGKASSSTSTSLKKFEGQHSNGDDPDDIFISVHPAKQPKMDKDGIVQPNTVKKAGATSSSNALRIYTDGSSLGNGRSGAVAGVGVYFGEGDARNVSEPLQGVLQTNQRAELAAILRALEIAPAHREVHIFSDSRYSINCVTTWFLNWEQNGWMTAQKKPVDNKDLIQAVLARIRERESKGSKTVFNWVQGHSTDPSNIAADRLAVSGAQQQMYNQRP